MSTEDQSWVRGHGTVQVSKSLFRYITIPITDVFPRVNYLSFFLLLFCRITSSSDKTPGYKVGQLHLM